MQREHIVIIAGVRPGIGASVARGFALEYPVVLLARNADNFESLAKDINDRGGYAVGIVADVTKPDSLDAAFDEIKKCFPQASCAAAIFNAAGGFIRKPLLDVALNEFFSGFLVNVQGAFLFSQHMLLLLLASAEKSKHPPTLIFTGATASIKANSQMATFACSKFALRTFVSSTAKGFAPQGVHVVHAIIDGPIDIPGLADFRKDLPADAKIAPDDNA